MEQLKSKQFLVNQEKEVKLQFMQVMKILIQSVHVLDLKEVVLQNVVDELNGEMIDIIDLEQ